MKRFFFVCGLSGAAALFFCDNFADSLGLTVVMCAVAAAAVVCTAAFFIIRACIRRSFDALLFAAAAIILFTGLWTAKYTAYKTEYDKYAASTGKYRITMLEESKATSGNNYSTIFRLEENGLRITVYSPFSPETEIGDTIETELSFFTDGGYDKYNRNNDVFISSYLSDDAVCETVAENRLPVSKFIAELRSKIKYTADKYFGDRSGIATAMLIGDKSGLTESESSAIVQAGISHTTAVSGLHVSLLIAILSFLLMPMRNKYIKVGIYAVMLVTLCAICSFTPSVIRAAIMTATVFAADLTGRESVRLNSLGIAVTAMMIINPFVTLNPSFLLSVLSSAGLAVLSMPAAKWLCSLLFVKPGIYPNAVLKAICGCISSSVSCFVFTYPAAIFFFGEVKAVGLLSNLVCIPLTQIVFIMCIATMGLAALPFCGQLAEFAGTLSSGGLGLYMNVAKFFSELDIASWQIQPWAVAISAAAGILCYVIIFITSKNRHKVKRFAVVAVPVTVTVVLIGLSILFSFLNVAPTAANVKNGVTFAYINVGQGSGSAVINGNEALVIDCGGSATPGDSIVSYLNKNGVDDVDTVIISHLHSDHANGISELCDAYDIDQIIIPYTDGDESIYARINNIAAREGATLTVISTDTTIDFDGVTIKILTEHLDPDSDDQNENSLVCIAQYGQFSSMFTGDITAAAERRLIAAYGDTLYATVLAVPHHGSKYSSCADFLAYVQPQYSVISVGNNSYGHPNDDVVSRLLEYGKVLRTDTDGTVEIVTNGTDFSINTIE